MKTEEKQKPRPKYLAVKFAENFQSREDENEIPLVVAHQDRIQKVAELGYKLITVDNGVGYFERIDQKPSIGPN